MSARDLGFSSLIASRPFLIMQQLFLVTFINHIVPKMTQSMAIPASCTSTIFTFKSLIFNELLLRAFDIVVFTVIVLAVAVMDIVVPMRSV
jgi:hypothetical protein